MQEHLCPITLVVTTEYFFKRLECQEKLVERMDRSINVTNSL